MAKKTDTTPEKKTKSIEINTVRGMHDVMDEEYYARQGFFEKAQEIAEYYGFKPIETPILEMSEVFEKGLGEGTDVVNKEMYSFKTRGRDNVVMRPEYTSAIMRAYFQHGMKSLPQPIMLYSFGPVFRHDKPQRGRYRQFWQWNMEILGTKKSIADAIIIQTTLTILKEAGAADLVVHLNSIGDRDSREDYLKELRGFYRKHINDLPADDRERLKTNPLRILDSKDPKTIEINAEAPESIQHLSNKSKKHFKEVLEYLEELEIPYQINKSLVRGLDYYSDTVFEIKETIKDDKGETELAITGGGRYDYLAETMGYNREVPGVGVALGVERVIQSPWWTGLDPRNIKKPKVYFIQFGFDAKLKSLGILEQLRHAKIPVAQSISKDSLSAQLGQAEKQGMNIVLIFGQKEAMDGTVIVKDMRKRSQATVTIDTLVSHIRSLK